MKLGELVNALRHMVDTLKKESAEANSSPKLTEKKPPGRAGHDRGHLVLSVNRLFTPVSRLSGLRRPKAEWGAGSVVIANPMPRACCRFGEWVYTLAYAHSGCRG